MAKSAEITDQLSNTRNALKGWKPTEVNNRRILSMVKKYLSQHLPNSSIFKEVSLSEFKRDTQGI